MSRKSIFIQAGEYSAEDFRKIVDGCDHIHFGSGVKVDMTGIIRLDRTQKQSAVKTKPQEPFWAKRWRN